MLKTRRLHSLTLTGGARSRGILENQLFHTPIVTSDLALKIKSRNHSRGRDSRVNPPRRVSKSFLSRILVSKFFDIRILRGISC
jgi:hypothetical protein